MSNSAEKMDLPLSGATSRLARDVEIARRQALGDRLSEDVIQSAVVRHLELRGKPGLVWLHPANGGFRSKAEAGRFKAIGVVAGAPDLMLFYDERTYALELKATGGRVSESQKLMHQRLSAAGVAVCVGFGLNEALKALQKWGLLKP